MVQERYERLVTLVDDIAWEENKRLVGREVEVLTSVGEGRKDQDTHRKTGRARDGRLVHFLDVDDRARPGDLVSTRVTYAAPHHLVADSETIVVVQTSGGDAHHRDRTPATDQVMLGLPTVRSI